MTAPFATLNGALISAGSLMVPLVGIWTADISINTDTAVTGAATVVLGNLTLKGTVVRSAVFAGQTRARIVGGGGGWRTRLPTKAYGQPSGVMLSDVLSDAAQECGEAVSVPSDLSVGPFYARPGYPVGGTASDVYPPASFTLSAFCPAWYVDTSGVTQIASWPVVVVASDFTAIDQRADEGVIEIATEDYASWLPGASFSCPFLAGTFQCAGVVYTFKETGIFRLQVLTDTAADRMLGPIHAIVDQRVSTKSYQGRYRYVISNPSRATVDATPVDPSIGLPALVGVPLASDSIATYIPPDGGQCHVMFLDGKLTYPICVWTAGTATVVNVMGGSNPVARQGDQTQSYLPPTLMLTCSGTLGGTPFVGTAVTSIPNPISGSITQGSPSANVP